MRGGLLSVMNNYLGTQLLWHPVCVVTGIISFFMYLIILWCFWCFKYSSTDYTECCGITPVDSRGRHCWTETTLLMKAAQRICLIVLFKQVGESYPQGHNTWNKILKMCVHCFKKIIYTFCVELRCLMETLFCLWKWRFRSGVNIMQSE